MAVLERAERVERVLGVVAEPAAKSLPAPVGTTASVRPVSAATPATAATRPSPPHATRSWPCSAASRARRTGSSAVSDTCDLGADRGRAFLDLGEELAGAPAPRHRVDDHGPAAVMARSCAQGSETSVQTRAARGAAARCAALRCLVVAQFDPGRISTLRATVPKHVAIVMDGNGRWAQRRGPEAHRGPRRGRGGAVRHRRGRARDRARVDDRVRVLHRELAPAARRGALPHELQRAPPGRPPRRAARQGRAGAVHRPPHRPGARAGCCAASRRPRR